MTSRSASVYGSGRSKTAQTTANTAALAPTPSASVSSVRRQQSPVRDSATDTRGGGDKRLSADETGGRRRRLSTVVISPRAPDRAFALPADRFAVGGDRARIGARAPQRDERLQGDCGAGRTGRRECLVVSRRCRQSVDTFVDRDSVRSVPGRESRHKRTPESR